MPRVGLVRRALAPLRFCPKTQQMVQRRLQQPDPAPRSGSGVHADRHGVFASDTRGEGGKER